MEFLILVGSTREGRKTVYPAQTAREEFEEAGHEVNYFDLKERDVPFMKERRYKSDGITADVEELGSMIESSDCLIIVTPEYNHSIPGVLKNALDYFYPEYEDKPFAYITTSAGGFGGIRAVRHLQDFTVTVGGFAGPSLPVSKINDVFDEEGRLRDEDYRERFTKFVDKCENFVQKLHKGIKSE